MFKYLIAVMVGAILILTQTSCQKHTSMSIIVVAVDSLSVSDISCTQKPASRSGLTVLCEESVRFTHAYTPSTLSGPAMASLLTGLYPFQHGLRHNGAPGLSASVVTAAEVAVEKRYRTGFFSGGAPLFRKVGINQGFEVFDDTHVPNLKSLFRPFKKNIELFQNWLKQEVRNDPFVAYFYVPDLSFLETTTLTPTAEVRSLSFESQLEELDGQLLELIKIIRDSGRWRNTLFVFTALNGRTPIKRRNEVEPVNLHSENTQVPLFVKPPQKVRDTNLNWTVDRDVSLVDVGVMMFDFLGHPLPISHGDFPSFSLRPSLFDVNIAPPEDRPVLMESGWPAWKNIGPIRAAVVRGADYIIWDQNPKLYNTLTDRFELNPLPISGAGQKFVSEMSQRLKKLKFREFTFENFNPSEKYNIPYLVWMDERQNENLRESLAELHRENPKDQEIMDWLAYFALEAKDIKTYKALAEKTKNPMWQMSTTDPCWKLESLPEIDPQLMKSCPDTLFVDLMAWQKADNRDANKEWLRAKVAREYYFHALDRKVLITNMALHRIWDINPQLTLKPTYTEIYFQKPETQHLKNTLLNYFPRIEEEL